MTARHLILAGIAAAACDPATPTPIEARDAVRAIPIAGAGCLDLSELSVCYEPSTSCSTPPCVLDKPVPAVPALSPLGYRCTGPAAHRQCIDRSRRADPFTCNGLRCLQRHPRLPDDGEWTCIDQAGAVVCRGGIAPAGVTHPQSGSGWHCGTLASGEARICVDFDPDYPDGNPSGWSCTFTHERGVRRVCEEVAARPAVLGSACTTEAPCVDGARCARGRCIPPLPDPSCWHDANCDGGVCRFGSCVERP